MHVSHGSLKSNKRRLGFGRRSSVAQILFALTALLLLPKCSDEDPQTRPCMEVDDGNPCTRDTCINATGMVVHENEPSTVSCSDKNECNGLEMCDGAGRCRAGVAVNCEPQDACHVAGVCEPATGKCSEPPAPDGTSCNDGDQDTLVDTCQSGTCMGRGPVLSVSTGLVHTCAAIGTGIARCWGNADWAQLGYGNLDTLGDDETPADVPGVPVGGIVSAVGVGDWHSCAIIEGGRVRCWGWNLHGQLGYVNKIDIGDDDVPADAGDVQVGGVATQIAGGHGHTCVLLDTGALRCWGYNQFGQLGYGHVFDIGDDEPPSAAGDVPLGERAVKVGAGGYHSCALTDKGGVRCWGQGFMGQLGYGNKDEVGDDELPSDVGDVPLGEPATDLAVGNLHVCALLKSGRVRCWGNNDYGQLGLGNMITIGDDESVLSVEPIDLGPGTVVKISAGGMHTCAIFDTGRARCWGDNEYGQLGVGNIISIGDDEAPAQGGDVDLGADIKVTHVALGRDHSCALVNKGQLRCWGRNNWGQLGYGNTLQLGDDEAPSVAGDVPVYR